VRGKGVAMKMASFRFSFLRALLFGGALLLGAGIARAADTADEATIRKLNDGYLQAFQKCDVAWYRMMLAEDFRAVLSDGRIIGKAEFLQQAAVPPAVTSFRLDGVLIRPYGDTAVVNGLVHYLKADGAPVLSRYTATYVRAKGQWQIVATQFTRVPPPTVAK
jgi:ketosteroid isomerase-like protein